MKTLLVTGASSDIGMELIKRVSSNYDKIFCHYCKSEDRILILRELIGEKIIPIQADFSIDNGADDFIKAFNENGCMPNHIVHLSAPKAYNKHFHKCLWEDFDEEIRTSFRSIVCILEKIIPAMRQKGYGKIVFMLTSYLVGISPKYQAPYIVSKYALLGLMKSLAAEYVDSGITVNAVSPDMIETRFNEDINNKIVWNNANKSPLGRNPKVEDVVPTFEFLLSDQADTLNGQNIGITGGMELAR